jgi:hypothetical protein
MRLSSPFHDLNLRCEPLETEYDESSIPGSFEHQRLPAAANI